MLKFFGKKQFKMAEIEGVQDRCFLLQFIDFPDFLIFFFQESKIIKSLILIDYH
jgi:hypothetical protein